MKNILLLAIALSLPFGAVAGVPLDPAGESPNFLFEDDPKALASSVYLAFQTGSMADPKGKEGLAMLSFRSLLRGTKERGKEEFFRTLERLGASIDVDVGAGRAIIGLNALSSNLEPALQLLAEAVLKPSLREAEIEAVRQESLAMLHQELSNNRKLLKRVFRQALFRDTSLAFPPEGTIAGMGALTGDDVRAFLASQLRSGSAVFAVSTNLPEALVKGWIEKAFAGLPDGEAPPLAVPTAPKPKGRTVFVMDRKGSTTTEIALGHLGITAGEKSREVLETGLYAFGEDMTSILFQELREKKGWTYGAAGGFDLFERPRRYQGGFMVWAFPQAEHTEELVLRALQLYEGYSKEGLTAKQLDFAKKALANSYPFKFATSRARLTARLYERLEGAPHHSVEAYRKIVGAVSSKTLKSAVRAAHDADNLVIVLVGDPARTEGLLKSVPRLRKVVRVTDAMAPLRSAPEQVAR